MINDTLHHIFKRNQFYWFLLLFCKCWKWQLWLSVSLQRLHVSTWNLHHLKVEQKIYKKCVDHFCVKWLIHDAFESPSFSFLVFFSSSSSSSFCSSTQTVCSSTPQKLLNILLWNFSCTFILVLSSAALKNRCVWCMTFTCRGQRLTFSVWSISRLFINGFAFWFFYCIELAKM